jgi:hypothetical protein
MQILPQLLVGILVQIAIASLLRWLALRIAKRRGTTFWRWAAWAPLVGLAFAVGGAIVSSAILVHTLRAIAFADPSIKASLLAKGISEAMNCSALLVLLTLVMYVGSAITSLAGWLKKA